jgi:plastocyanin
MHQFILSLGSIALASALLLGCAGSSEESSQNADDALVDEDSPVIDGAQASVSMSSMKFVKSSIKVHAGTTVTWNNASAVTHTVTSGKNSKPASKPGALFDATVNPGESFSFTFTDTGKVPYFCRPHEVMKMKGTVTVIP